MHMVEPRIYAIPMFKDDKLVGSSVVTQVYFVAISATYGVYDGIRVNGDL